MNRLTKIAAGLLAAGGSSLALADANVTIAHFAPFADTLEGTSVTIAVNGDTLLENVEFQAFTEPLALDAGEYTVDIIPTGASEAAITETFTLEDDTDYTLFATGNGTLQPLDLVALVDDNTAPAAGSVKIRVYHSAPFAAELADTEVSIRTAGGDLVADLTGVPYGVGSDYLELPADTYDLKVASNDGTTNFIDPLPVDLPDGTIVTLFAVGDIVNQPLGIIAVPVGTLDLRTPVNEDALGIFQLIDADGNVLAGQGFNFSPIASQNRVAGTWFTYDDDGDPTFLTFDSEPAGFDGTDAVTTLFSSSAEEDPTSDPELEEIGTITFGVEDCRTIVAEVTIDGESTDFEGRRLTPNAVCPAPSAE